jgi:AraC-like DNA-binding protein
MHHVRRILTTVERLGADAAQLAADLGLDQAEIHTPDARLPHDRMQALWHEAFRRTGDEAFGIRVIEVNRAQPMDFVLGYAAMASATLGDAYRRAIRYVHLNHQASEVHVSVEGAHAHLRYRVVAASGPTRYGAEYGLALVYELGRRVLGEAFRGQEIRFAHGPPRSAEVHERFFAAPVRFGQPETEFLFDRALLAAPLPNADPVLTGILDRHMAGLLKDLPAPVGFAGRVREAIVRSLRDGTPTSEAIAGQLRCSVRTLHRRLGEETQTFQGLLDSVRYEAAVRQLEDERVEIGAIAFLLGFSEVSAFYRAFRRWAGCTPVEYRRARRAAPAPA